MPSLNVGVSRGSQRSKPGRGQMQSFHSARGTIRKVQSLLCPYPGTTGKAAILASGLPFLLTIRKFVEMGILRSHFEQGTVRSQRYVFFMDSAPRQAALKQWPRVESRSGFSLFLLATTQQEAETERTAKTFANSLVNLSCICFNLRCESPTKLSRILNSCFKH